MSCDCERDKFPLKPTGVRSSLMIIGDACTYYESDANTMFIGNVANWLFRKLNEQGIDEKKCYFTKLIKCYSEKKVTSKTIKACKEFLLREIADVKPQYLLLLGSVVSKTLLGKPLKDTRGRLIDVEINGIQVQALSVEHPNSVIKFPEHLGIFEDDLKFLVRGMRGIEKPQVDFEVVRTVERAEEVIAKMHRDKTPVAYDVETGSLTDTNERLFMLGLATSEKVYVFVEDIVAYWHIQNMLNGLLRDKNTVKIAHNAQFDDMWLRSRGIHPHCTFDTMLAIHAIDVNSPKDLKFLAKKYCGAGEYSKDVEYKKNYTQSELEPMYEYCALDVYYTLQLYAIFRQKLVENIKQAKLFAYITMPSLRTLESVFDIGWYLSEELPNIKAQYETRQKELADTLLPFGNDVNWNSPAQVGKVLFDDLNLKSNKVTASGQKSTGKSVLKKLAVKNELPRTILEYKNTSKALSSFLVPWESLYDKNRRIHSRYKMITDTNRLSCVEPNLQQVPRAENIRKIVSVPTGKAMIEADYSQIELRVAAMIANESTMKEIYRAGGDIHTSTASALCGGTPTKEDRTKAKAVNFGFLFGMGWKSFMEYAFDNYGVVFTPDQAKESRAVFFRNYPQLLTYHENQRRLVNRDMYIDSPVGFRRHLPNVRSADNEVRSMAERQAINTPIQNMAGEMTLLAMTLIAESLEGTDRIVGQIHDAILVECDEGNIESVGMMIKNIMENEVPKKIEEIFGYKFDIPILAEVACGKGWGQGKKIF